MVLAIRFWSFLTKSTLLKPRLLAPLQTSFFMLVLLIVGQQGLNLWLGLLIRETGNRVSHSLLVDHEGERLLSKNNRQQQNSFGSSINRLYTLVKDNQTQLKQLNKIKNLHVLQQNQLLKKPLFDSAGKYALQEKDLFNSLHAQSRVLLLYEKRLLKEQQHRLQQLYYINTTVNILCAVIILTGAGLILRQLHRRVELPLRSLINIGNLWQAGQLEAQFRYSSADEIGHLTTVLNGVVSKFEHQYKSLKVQNQELKDLIGALSHDLRTPLLATRNTLDSMSKGVFGPLSDTCRKMCEEYRQANEELLKLVEALLNVSRYEAGYRNHLDCEPLNWEKILVKTIAHIKASAKHDLILTYKIPKSLPTVYGDELEIQRVLQNLLDNAVRVSGSNKEISLEVKNLEETKVKVCVCDRGPGIAPQEKKQLFRRFVQGRCQPGRSGLGLYLCSRIIEAHKGTIGVESSLGEGSTFWFTLPVSANQVRYQNE
ncbi:HAMP domain-containing sensor histidine kinase [Chlorogloeopsis sp. ULAP01]|uniref:sensor histidine kinase n=1 Tax=Chlorogloeopsis sp. ULAP01 TaxID=3056483 RepID=UPI0025AA8868|nr:HAMP domain-containing sensor histidine kinase [Chlorogloeopsis sp. ULAP01]MDM9383465.1 HAMP domain-containing sensor histidine kinase [Chlorogloeopsis sp. ULAP01]